MSAAPQDQDARAKPQATMAETMRAVAWSFFGIRRAADYERLGAQIVLGNTYHLMLRPGAETVARFGGCNARR